MFTNLIWIYRLFNFRRQKKPNVDIQIVKKDIFFIKINIVSLKQKADCIISYTQNDFQGEERKNIG